jgi:hypothetical protein
MIRIRFQACKSPLVAVGLATALLAACGDGAPVTPEEHSKPDSAEAGYLAPPTVESVVRAPGRVTLSGRAAPKAEVRLRAPTGEAFKTNANAAGQWSLAVPTQTGVRLFGLSETHAGRTVQAEGYMMVSQDGDVAQLRAGAGVYRLVAGSSSPKILAVDVDREGGAVVSGVASPGAGLNVRVDRTTRGGGRADDQGHFYISLRDQLAPGAHDVQIGGEGGEDAVSVVVSSPAPLTAGPVRSERTPVGWRVDWLTPGGGVQTTLLIGDAR